MSSGRRPPWITDEMLAQALDAIHHLDSYHDEEGQARRRHFQQRWGLTDQQANAAWAEDPALRIVGRSQHEHEELRRDVEHQQIALIGDIHRREIDAHLDLMLWFSLTAEQAETLWHWVIIQDGCPTDPQGTAGAADIAQATPLQPRSAPHCSAPRPQLLGGGATRGCRCGPRSVG